MPLLIAFLLLQNITISGTLKDADGKSLTGVRVAAMPVAGRFSFLKNILDVYPTTTDKNGRYTLELPPGAYYVVAGNVSKPTYYTALGSKVVISTSRDGADFVVNAASFRSVLRREELPPRPIQWDTPPRPPKFQPR
jgi:Carboxypeptidase regulatory-like domain